MTTMMTTTELKTQVQEAELPWYEPQENTWTSPFSKLVSTPSGFEHQTEDARFRPDLDDPEFDPTGPIHEYTRWINQWYINRFRELIEAEGLPWDDAFHYSTHDGGGFEWVHEKGRLVTLIEIDGRFIGFLLKSPQSDPPGFKDGTDLINLYREYISWRTNSTS